MKYLFEDLAALEGQHITGERHLGADNSESHRWAHWAINLYKMSSPLPPLSLPAWEGTERVKHPGMTQSCGQEDRNVVSELGWRKGNDSPSLALKTSYKPSNWWTVHCAHGSGAGTGRSWLWQWGCLPRSAWLEGGVKAQILHRVSGPRAFLSLSWFRLRTTGFLLCQLSVCWESSAGQSGPPKFSLRW